MCAVDLGRPQRGLNLPRDLRGDPVLQREEIVEPVVEPLRPEQPAIAAAHELHRDAHAVPRTLDGALDKVVGPQPLGRRANVETLVAEREGGLARDHLELACPAQRARDLLDHAIREHVGLGHADLTEGEDRKTRQAAAGDRGSGRHRALRRRVRHAGSAKPVLECFRRKVEAFEKFARAAHVGRDRGGAEPDALPVRLDHGGGQGAAKRRQLLPERRPRLLL